MTASGTDDTASLDEITAALAAVEFERIPDDVVETVRRCFLDTIGVTLLGTTSDAFDIAWKSFDEGHAADDGVTVFGTGTLSSVTDAAFLNGIAAHAFDYDDVSDAITGHPSATLVPTILAVADREGAPGRDLITAYVIGFETAATIGAPISPHHYERGWHSTATLGTFGAAAATTSLLDGGPSEFTDALNIAASLPSGLKRNFGSLVKPMHVGQAARSGVTAGILAGNGFEGDSDAISTPGGFLDLYGGEAEVGELGMPQAGETIRQQGIDVKKYPCCYFTHAGIEATRSLVREHAIAPADVRRVKATISGGAADALVHPDPTTESEAKFSMEHAIAVAIEGPVEQASFETPTITDAVTADRRTRIDVVADSTLPYPSYKTTIELSLAEGSDVSAVQTVPPGKAGNPLTEREQQEKFRRCATAVLTDEAAEQVATLCTDLPELADASRLTAFL